MRAAFLFACALGGCGVLEAARAPACRAEAERAITWSHESAPDRLLMRATGADCANADIIAIVTSADGKEVLRARALGHAMAAFGDNLPSPLPPVSTAEMTEYVGSLASSATMLTASELPAWAAPGELRLPRAAEGPAYDPLLPRDAYYDLRTRNVRVLCFDTGPEAATCYAYDPVARRAVAIATHGL